MDYYGVFKKNIGMFFSETLNLLYTNWPSRLNTMDEVWVPSNEAYQVCKDSGVTVPVQIIPCAADISKYEAVYPIYSLPHTINGTFKFYFIGEHIRRKRLTAAIIAYYTNFTKYDNVSFVIKSSKSGYEAQDCLDEIEANIEALKKNLRLYRDPTDYPSHCIITGHIPENELMSIHQQCDCFVMPSFGEGWCIPAFDAMGFGNSVIATDSGGLTDFLAYYNKGHIISAETEPVYGYDIVFDDMHTGLDNWKAVSVREFGKAMRKVYENKKDILPNSAGIIEHYSYKSIGEAMGTGLIIKTEKLNG
jgi:glycosyltransferase involved in cell wall biosynthesis